MSPTNNYFWIWVLKKSVGTISQKYVFCAQDFYPRWDFFYLCQAFTPTNVTSWFWGKRWYCGSTNYYSPCNKQYELPTGWMYTINMTGIPYFSGRYYAVCCNIYYSEMARLGLIWSHQKIFILNLSLFENNHQLVLIKISFNSS